MAKMSNKSFVGWVGLSLLIAGLNASDIIRTIVKDYESIEKCGTYSDLGKYKRSRGGTRYFVKLMIDGVMVRYNFYSTSAYLKTVEESPSINSIICITTYKNKYSIDSDISIFKVSIDDKSIYQDGGLIYQDGKLIYQDEHDAGDTFSYSLIGIGLIFLAIYWLLSMRKK